MGTRRKKLFFFLTLCFALQFALQAWANPSWTFSGGATENRSNVQKKCGEVSYWSPEVGKSVVVSDQENLTENFQAGMVSVRAYVLAFRCTILSKISVARGQFL